MPLLPDAVVKKLPPLGFQQHLADPIVYARFFIPNSVTAWYATEGSREGGDYVFFGCRTSEGGDLTWGFFRISELNALRGPVGEPVVFDENFSEGRFIDVVLEPWSNRMKGSGSTQ